MGSAFTDQPYTDQAITRDFVQDGPPPNPPAQEFPTKKSTATAQGIEYDRDGRVVDVSGLVSQPALPQAPHFWAFDTVDGFARDIYRNGGGFGQDFLDNQA